MTVECKHLRETEDYCYIFVVRLLLLIKVCLSTCSKIQAVLGCLEKIEIVLIIKTGQSLLLSCVLINTG